MAYKGKAKQNTGTVFMDRTEGKFGTFYSGAFPDVGVVQMELNAEGQLLVKANGGSEMIQPKTNDYGAYFIAKVGDNRYFVSERENSRGKYLMAKLAPERPLDTAGRPQRPETYAKRAEPSK